MGYYVRVFCTSPTVPDVPTIQTCLRDQGTTVVIGWPDSAKPKRRRNQDWRQLLLTYEHGNDPILADCDRSDSEGAAL